MSPSRQPSAVLFDLDDTLYPERQFVDGGFRAVARFLGPLLGEGDEALTSRLWSLHDRDGRGHLFDALLAEYGHGDDADLILACLVTYRTHRPRLELFPGIVEAIGDIREAHVPIGLLSDGQASVQRRKLAALPALERSLDVVVLTDELGHGCAKPSPVGFRVAARLLGIDPTQAVYVGNDTRKDFSGARAAGLRTIRTGRPPDEGRGKMDAVDGRVEADVVVASAANLAAVALGRSPLHEVGRVTT